MELGANREMNKFMPEECLDIGRKETYKVELEIDQEGDATIICPCCEGDGEHPDRAGNDPTAQVYQCQTCEGRGTLKPRMRTVRASWNGISLSNQLNLKPSRHEEQTWHIHGLGEKREATGSTVEMVKLAHLILDKMEPAGKMERLAWVTEYRRIKTSSTLQEAMQAFDQERGEPKRPETRE